MATSMRGEVVETRELYLISTGMPISDYNLAMPKDPMQRAEPALDQAARYFEARSFPYRVCVRADCAAASREILHGRGFAEQDAIPGMVLSPMQEAPDPPDGLVMRRVDGAESLAHFRKTAFEGFGLPVAAAALFLTEEFLALPHVALFVGYVDEEPAATAALVGTPGVAGIYWVATLAPYRGRGYGAALSWQAVAAGRELEYPLASLQASQMGRPVYARMGFAHDRDYAQFDSPPT